MPKKNKKNYGDYHRIQNYLSNKLNQNSQIMKLTLSVISLRLYDKQREVLLNESLV